jgi:hypothetical protein
MEPASERVVIGMDPHKRSVTIEVMVAHERVLGGGRSAPTSPAIAPVPECGVTVGALVNHGVVLKQRVDWPVPEELS